MSVTALLDPEFHVISNLQCSKCVEALQPLIDLYGEKVKVYGITEGNNTNKFNSIINLIGQEPYTIPLVALFEKDRLVSIVFGYHSKEGWETILTTNHSGVPVYYNQYEEDIIVPNQILSDPDCILNISKIFIEDFFPSYYDKRSLYELLPVISMAALIDAINPCEFYVLIVFLSIVVMQIGRNAVLKSGISYAAAIFISYFLLGFSILRLFELAEQIKPVFIMVISIFGIIMGSREIIGSVRNSKIKRVPDILSKRLSANLRRVTDNPLTAFGIGFLAGIFLLPCTSGPYFIALGLISNLDRILDGIVLLSVYNSIIVLPFIVITLGIYTLRLKTSKLKKWSAQKQRLISFTSGLAIIILSIYFLFTTTF